MPTDKQGAATSPAVYSHNIIQPAAHSMADAFIQRVQRFRPEDQIELVRLVRERIESSDPQIANLLAGKP